MLNQLPETEFIETDASIIIADILRNYEAVTGQAVAQGSPIRLFLMSLAYEIVLLRQQTEHGLKQNLLYYAEGEKLDHLAAMRMLTRKPAEQAVTTLQFTLSAPRPNAILIPANTRATSDNQTYFATVENISIPAGETVGTVAARAIGGGALGNRIGIGLITALVDPIQYVQSVTNTTITQGGADAESDADFRERIFNAPSSFSVAGPAEAYKFIAKSASAAIIDVAASSPTPGNVLIQPLMQGGELPTQTIIDLVYQAVNADTVRPLADFVTVTAPTRQNYDLNVTYWISRDNQGRASEIQTAVMQAVQEWTAWQSEKLGRDINPSELIKRMVEAGAKRVNVVTPSFVALAAGAVAVQGSQTIGFGGLEDE